jgi:hypothetical protein
MITLNINGLNSPSRDMAYMKEFKMKPNDFTDKRFVLDLKALI